MNRSEHSNTASRTTPVQVENPGPVPSSDTIIGEWLGGVVRLDLKGANLEVSIPVRDGDDEWDLDVSIIRAEFSTSATFASNVQLVNFAPPRGLLKHEFTNLAASTTYYARAFMIFE